MIFSQVSIILWCSRTRKLGLLIIVCDWQNHDGFIIPFFNISSNLGEILTLARKKTLIVAKVSVK